MNQREPIQRSPIRSAAIVAGVAALLGSGVVFVPEIAPPLALAFAVALGYGAFLGWYVVGLLLASSVPATRWWWTSSAPLFASLAVLGIWVARWPESVLLWWEFIGGVLLLFIASWLVAGCLLAGYGWWSYARHRRLDNLDNEAS